MKPTNIILIIHVEEEVAHSIQSQVKKNISEEVQKCVWNTQWEIWCYLWNKTYQKYLYK